ncbi:MAG TPA: hypothetical protein VGK99_13225 [Acidobacteriota bacterium]|jgi:hypothetical protein
MLFVGLVPWWFKSDLTTKAPSQLNGTLAMSWIIPVAMPWIIPACTCKPAFFSRSLAPAWTVR